MTLEENINYIKDIVPLIFSNPEKRSTSAFSKYYINKDKGYIIQIMIDIHGEVGNIIKKKTHHISRHRFNHNIVFFNCAYFFCKR